MLYKGIQKIKPVLNLKAESVVKTFTPKNHTPVSPASERNERPHEQGRRRERANNRAVYGGRSWSQRTSCARPRGGPESYIAESITLEDRSDKDIHPPQCPSELFARPADRTADSRLTVKEL